MEVNTAFDQNSITENRIEKMTIDQILGRIVYVSRSGDGKCLFFTDCFDKTIRVRIPNSELDKDVGNHYDGKIIPRTNKIRSSCGCVSEHFCGMTILVNPNTGEPCSHR